MQLAGGGHAHARMSTQTKLNDLVGLVLLAFLALAPLPLGGNRPFFWVAGAAFLAVLGLVYGLLLAAGGRTLRYPLTRIPEVAGLAAILICHLVLQLLPIAPLLGRATRTFGGGVTVVSSTISLAPGPTALMLIQLAGYAMLFFLVAQVAVNPHRGRHMLRVLFWVTVAYAVYGLVSLTQLGDTLLGLEKWAYPGSATGTFVNRNSFATFLAFGAVMGAAIAIELAAPEPDRPAARAWLGEFVLVLVGVIFLVGALLATQSRMGVAAASVGALVVVVGGLWRARITAGHWLAAAAIAVALVGGLVYLFGLGLLERLGSVESSADVRFQLYQQVAQMIAAEPWFGHGGGSFAAVFPLFHQLPVSPDLVWDMAHSTYLALWAELGVVAGSLPLLIVAALVLRMLPGLAGEPRQRTPILAAIGMVVVAAIHSTVDFGLEIQANAQLLLAVLAIATAATGWPRSRGESTT